MKFEIVQSVLRQPKMGSLFQMCYKKIHKYCRIVPIVVSSAQLWKNYCTEWTIVMQNRFKIMAQLHNNSLFKFLIKFKFKFLNQNQSGQLWCRIAPKLWHSCAIGKNATVQQMLYLDERCVLHNIIFFQANCLSDLLSQGKWLRNWSLI